MSADFPSEPPASDPISDPETELSANVADSGQFQTYSDMPPDQNLSNVQLRAIELITQGHNDLQTARTLSINPKTLWRWKNLDEDYREALTEARHQLHATVTDRYENIVFKATSILLKFLEDPTDSSRMKAAQILLNMASRYKPAPLPKRPTDDPDDYWPAPLLPPKVG